MSSGKIWVSFSRVTRAPRIRPGRSQRQYCSANPRTGGAGVVTEELLPLGPPLQRRSQKVGRGVGQLGGLSVGVDGLLQHVVTAQLLGQAVLRLSTGHGDSTDPPGMKATRALMMMLVPGPSRSERADSEDAAAPARQKPSEPPPVCPDSPDTQDA